MIEAGKVLQQRYRIDKQIGQGGMGAVYVATDERFGSTVAIKETLCMDDNFRKAIEREARLLNSLKHSALPRVSDHFEEDNGQFLVMEYIPGDDVGCILDREQKPFDIEQVLKWADQLLDALDYLHNQDIPVIHRDIKPQNLKITTRGQIILLDFGLAKGNPTDASHNTAAKSIFGYSRNYASLEQIQGTGTDPRSDLYSLSATLYHLMTNTVPEDALTRAMSVLSQSGDTLVPANALNPDIPRGVAGVLQKALDLNAGGRPSSATQMQQMLRDSDAFGYLADAATLSATVADAQVFAQATKLMPDETRAQQTKQTDVKTEVMPAPVSEMTSVKLTGSAGPTNVAVAHQTTAAPQQRRFGMPAAALALVLVGVAVAGGLYIVNPSMFGTKAEPDATTVSPAPAAVVDTNVNAAPAGSETAGSGTQTTPPTDGPTRQADKPNEKRADAPGTSSKQNDDADEPDDVVVTEDKTEQGTTRTITVRPIPPANGGPPPNGFDPFPRGFDPSRLTPEQRRRIQRAIRNGQMPQPANVPKKP